MESGSIPNDAIKASSELDEQHSALRARLNTKPEGEQMGAWVPFESDENQWLQVDLGKVTRLTKIAVQGEAGDSSRHVKEFTVSCSFSEEGFIAYREDGSEKVNCFQMLGSVHTNAFSKMSVFISAKTKQNIFTHTRVFLSFSPIHTETLETRKTR